MSEARILVVDDNEMNRDMLSRRLQRQGYHVEMAENGEHCLEMMKDTNFELVLLDVMMPKMNGYEVLAILKSENKWRQIPVIMISAVDDLDSVVKCIELGAEDYLFKPFNPVLLKARVSATLDKYRNQSWANPETIRAIITDAYKLLENADDEQKDLLNQIIANAKMLI